MFMALSDKKILQEVLKGDIVVLPFDERNLSTSSYDVTLGENYYRANSLLPKKVFNIYSEYETKEVWGKPQVASVVNGEVGVGDGINAGDKIILIGPGETILAHTNEFIGGKDHITTMMKSRSSMGRQFIAVCKCAGWGDVGYVNRWTMEITNYSDYTIPLVVGRRIAQIVFFETGPIQSKDYAVAGKYQTSQDIEELVKNWKPEEMLPKLHKDRDIKK